MTTRIPVRLLIVSMLATLWLGGASAVDAKTPERTRTWTITFQADTLGQAPNHATVDDGTWEVLEDSTAAPIDSAGAYPRYLRQAEGNESNAAHAIRFAKPSLRNGEVSTRFRIVSGELDPSVGILSRMDAKGRNGYLVRLSGAKSELIVHYLIYGKRRDLKFAAIEPPAVGEWHTLAVRHEGVTITVLYDGVPRMSVRDERHRKGFAGLWTEDDTVADFSEVRVTVR